MPGDAHEVLVDTLREKPALLGALVERLTGRTLPSGLLPVDSAVRFVKAAEVRPDILLAEHGAEAKDVLVRAVDLTKRLPPPLQKAQMDAIFSVLSRRILKWLRELSMDRNKISMDPTARKLSELFHARWDASFVEGQAEGEVKGKHDALFSFLQARGLVATTEQRAAIAACSDLPTLDAWIVRAASASTVADVLAPANVSRASRAPRRVTAGRSAARKGP